MIDLKTFRKIKELKEKGVMTKRILEELNISKGMYYKWGLLSEETFMKHLKNRVDNGLYNYREFILSIISVTPQINDTAIMYRCMEEFPDFAIPRMTFFRYVKKIRAESGYVKEERRRYSITEESLPGVEAQVDFGQMKLKSMYGGDVRVYFFCMILSYSRMRFVYFSIDPFTTETACEAHDYAFKFFGGRTESILYDQDRLFLVSQNYGDFILTDKFGEYVKKMGFTANFCHKHDPETKAKVENTVHIIKQGFLKGRVYTGIDSLNVACLEWLDRFANGDYHHITKKIPKEMFKEEYKTLTKVKFDKKETTTIMTVRKLNQVHYRGNIYEIPSEYKMEHMRVKLVEKDDVLYIYKPITDELICKHNIPIGQGRVLSSHNANRGDNDLYVRQINLFFGDNEIKNKYMDGCLRKGNPSYIVSQNRRLVRMTKYYSKEELLEAMKYCIKADKCSMHELGSYLVYLLGTDRARAYLHHTDFAMFKKRAKIIKEELESGRH